VLSVVVLIDVMLSAVAPTHSSELCSFPLIETVLVKMQS
jgi:hypothetical protein